MKCAQCQSDWMARPQVPDIVQDNNKNSIVDPTDKIMDQIEENQLDAGFEAHVGNSAKSVGEKSAPSNVVAGPGLNSEAQIDAATIARQRTDMAKRHSLLNRNMPKARFKRGVHVAGAVILALMAIGGVLFRENIVRTFPDMAGIYSSVGLGVNVVGLEFSGVQTLISLKNGMEVMDISASIGSVSSRQVSVPPIIVTLLDGEGNSLYEWSVTARAAIMLPGEVIEMSTQLTSPPAQTKTVRLTFEGSK